ncbi:HAD family hydrolase [Candidatus Similichlamydia laticola]|uniref:Pseudouridine-5' phosphatase n=1 Tax=Candidatus Similichlamydia laticola TaxID=2170265 RepID=A0A369KEJ4_9BACT|nr:HAD-IA family hydrolase [Candidatus Similichlamydia laticola]RDB31870.1 Pseudouridine-5' phosphatase [Candidatus Similichlamydia laticola]
MAPLHSAEIQLCIFDLDGTLVNTERSTKRSWNQALLELGCDPKLYPIDPIVGLSTDQWEHVLPKIYGASFPFEAFFEAFKRMSVDEDLTEIKIMPGARELLIQLKGKGKACGIATSNLRNVAMAILEYMNLLSFFSFVCTRDDVVHAKPDPSLYQLALEKGESSPDQAYALEDSFVGCLAAQSAGLRSILVPTVPLTDAQKAQLHSCEYHTSLLELLS